MKSLVQTAEKKLDGNNDCDFIGREDQAESRDRKNGQKLVPTFTVYPCC